LLGFFALVGALALGWRAGGPAPSLDRAASFACSIALASVVAGGAAPMSVQIAGDLALIGALALAHYVLATLSGPPSLASAIAPPRPLTAALPVLVAAFGAFEASSARAVSGALLAGTLAASAAVVLGFCAVELARRRLELGVRARTLAGFASLALGLGASAAASALLRSGFSDVAMRGALAPAALAATLVALHGSELRVANGARVLTVLATLGGGLVLFALVIAARSPFDSPTVVLIAGVLALAIGVSAPALADGLRPERGAMLEAIGEAESSLLRSDAEEAVRDALVRLRAPAGPNAPSPELLTFDPMRVLRVDAAGYAHEGEGSFPAEVVRVASVEPEATLRAEVLERLEVRRPDLRPVLKWLSDRGALAATVITEGGEARGFLVVPQGGRSDAMTLEEVTALKRLADRFASILGYRAAIARGLERERVLGGKIDVLEDRILALEHAQAREVARHERATLRLARPAAVGLYAPSSRLAFDALEAKARLGAPFVVLHPSGIDPVPYVARAHLGGARGKGPLVLVDGTAAREHEVERWSDRVASPLALADGGTLLLVDGGALPADVQRIVAQAMAEKRAPWERAEPLDVVVALTSVMSREALEPRLDPALAVRLAGALDAAVTLPALAERPEDLRSLLTDRLAREGLRVFGAPVALGDGALARLIERGFPGDEAELSAMVVRLVAGLPRSAAEPGSPQGPAIIQADDIDRLDAAQNQSRAEGSARDLGTPRIRLV
jgi:hypothetical protein